MRIYIIRHGDPNYDLDALTDRGHEQAKLLSERMIEEPIDKIYTSPQGRARQTAQYTADKFGLTPEVLPWLHEMEWGDLKGAPYSSGNPWNSAEDMFVKRGILPKEDSWREDREFIQNRIVPDYAKRTAALDEFLAQKGYVREGSRYKCVKENGESVAFFCHGGITCTMYSYLLNIPFPLVCSHMMFFMTSVSAIELWGKEGSFLTPKNLLTNDVTHLRGKDLL